MGISVISTPSTQFTIPPNQALTVENLGPGEVFWGRFAVDGISHEGEIEPSRTMTFFAPFGPTVYLSASQSTQVNTTFVPFPQAAAMLGTDGTLGGPGGSPLSPSVVSASSSSGINPVVGVLPIANILDPQWGGKADAIQAAGGAITSGQNTLSITGGFVTGDVGKFVMVPGAGPSGAGAPGPFVAYIGSVAGGVASLVTAKGGSTAKNASNTVSSATVTYGTGCGPAINSAIGSGYRVHLPVGSYIWDTLITASKPPHITGDGIGRTKIYYPSGQGIMLSFIGTGLVGSTATLASNAAALDTSLGVSSVPTGLGVGDYLFLSSTDVFDAAETFCTRGEFLRVYGISGTTIYLQSPVVGPSAYRTAATATIQKVQFTPGVLIRDLEVINGTPEQIIAGPATPATQVVNAGGGNVFAFRKCFGPIVQNLKVTGWSGDFVEFTNCIFFNANNISARDGAQVPNAAAGNSYGYCISAYGSQWGTIDGGDIENSHGFFNAEGTGQIGGDIVLPTSSLEIRDVISRNGVSEPHLCHNAAAFIDFIDCKVIGGPKFPTENSHNAGFQITGYYCRLIDCVAENATGVPFNLVGPHCEIIRPILRNIVPWNDRVDGIVLAAPNCRVRDADIDTILGAGASTARGIHISPGATNCEISGRSTIRNTASDAIFIEDNSDTCVIDGVTCINGGRYVVETVVASPAAQWSNVSGTATLGVTSTPSGLVPKSPGDMLPGLIVGSLTGAQAFQIAAGDANRAMFARFVPQRFMIATKISFVVSTNATTNDAVDVGIYDAGLNRLASAGSTSGVANVAALAVLTLTAPVNLFPGTVYYVAFAYGSIGGTASQVIASTTNGTVANLFGAAAPLVLWSFQNTAFPLPTTLTAGGAIAHMPILAVRES